MLLSRIHVCADYFCGSSNAHIHLHIVIRVSFPHHRTIFIIIQHRQTRIYKFTYFSPLYCNPRPSWIMAFPLLGNLAIIHQKSLLRWGSPPLAGGDESAAFKITLRNHPQGRSYSWSRAISWKNSSLSMPRFETGTTQAAGGLNWTIRASHIWKLKKTTTQMVLMNMEWGQTSSHASRKNALLINNGFLSAKDQISFIHSRIPQQSIGNFKCMQTFLNWVQTCIHCLIMHSTQWNRQAI